MRTFNFAKDSQSKQMRNVSREENILISCTNTMVLFTQITLYVYLYVCIETFMYVSTTQVKD